MSSTAISWRKQNLLFSESDTESHAEETHQLPDVQVVENSDPQCVKCNEIFTTSTELYEHKLGSHDKLDCQICKEKEKVIEELQEHNESLVKKNVALHKELRRTKLAFKESTHEKAEINKELTLQRESWQRLLRRIPYLTRKLE